MPELPEVETIKNDLRELVLGRRIEGVRVLDRTALKHVPPEGLDVAGERIEDVARRAKYLLIRMSSGRYVVVQLMLNGQLLLTPRGEPLRANTRVIFELDGGEELRLVDSRHFARVHLVRPEELSTKLRLDRLGPEALGDEFTAEELARRLRGRKAAIKALLLDQHVVAGIGNIYADEILFRARLHPAEPAGLLSAEQVRRLYEAIRATLREGVAHRGTTTQAYLDVRGQKGHHQDYLQVHARAGKPCPGCAGQVERIKVGGREGYYCPSCQVLSEEAARRRRAA